MFSSYQEALYNLHIQSKMKTKKNKMITAYDLSHYISYIVKGTSFHAVINYKLLINHKNT